MNLSLPQTLYGGGLVLPYRDHQPVIGDEVFIAPHASVIGQTTLGDRVSIWFGSVLRGDIAPVSVGEASNIQDLSVLHVADENPCIVGKYVVVGHRVTLHGCRVEDDCLIGMGSIILNGAVIGEGSLVGAGTLVLEKMQVPPHSLVLGSPAHIVRELKNGEWEKHHQLAQKYIRVTENYRPLF